METKNFITRRFEKLALLTIMFFSSIIAFAQEATKPVNVDVTTTKTTTTTTEEWMTNPLYWVIGALVLILIIALVARGNKSNA